MTEQRCLCIWCCGLGDSKSHGKKESDRSANPLVQLYTIRVDEHLAAAESTVRHPILTALPNAYMMFYADISLSP